MWYYCAASIRRVQHRSWGQRKIMQILSRQKRAIVLWGTLALLCPSSGLAQKSTYAGSSSTSSASGGTGSDSTKTKGSDSSGDSQQAGKGASGGGSSFSIEAEILAYKALASDSEAIACDIANYLHASSGLALPQPQNGMTGKKFDPLSSGCQNLIVPAVAGTPFPGVIILPSNDTTTLANMQLWRANMSIVRQLLTKSKEYSCPSQHQVVEGVPVLDAAEQAVTLTKDILQLFASTESVVGVSGAIQDEALVDSVARDLRDLKVAVLIPATYSPFALGGVGDSPFLSQLAKLAAAHSCLATSQLSDTVALAALQTIASGEQVLRDPKTAAQDKAAKQVEIDQAKRILGSVKPSHPDAPALQLVVNARASLLSAIDNYVSILNGVAADTSSGSKSQGGQTGAGISKSTNTADAGNQPQQTSKAPQSNSQAPISAILAADGLARELGVDQRGNFIDPGWHVLWLKALESGGGVLSKSNIFGSKLYFSGGAVATYELFKLNGQLSCSGNVYDYGGALREKHFSKDFRKPDISPEQQLVFFRGRCDAAEAPDNPKEQRGGVAGEHLISTNPSQLVFGDQKAGSVSESKSLTITNVSTSGVNIGELSVDDEAFTIDRNTCSEILKASASCTVAIKFKPASQAAYKAQLKIPLDYGPELVSITGAGVQ
jgi:hypothetical protein